MFGWYDKLEKAVYDSIVNVFARAAEDSINMVLDLFSGIHSAAQKVLEYDFIIQAIIYAQSVAIVLLAVKIAFESMNTYILRISGDATADPGGILIRAMVSAAIISAVPWILAFLYRIGTALTEDLSNLPGNDPMAGASDNVYVELLNYLLVDSVNYLIFMAIGILVVVILSVVIVLQMAIRAAELALVGIVGPFMAISLNSNMFGVWWKKLITLILAQAVQILMLRLSFYVFHRLFFDAKIIDIVIFIGFLWVTVKSPKILEQFVDSTGLGKFVGGTAQSAGTMIMMRKMFTRGV